MTDTPVNTWELAQNIPEDMSKPQNPLPDILCESYLFDELES